MIMIMIMPFWNGRAVTRMMTISKIMTNNSNNSSSGSSNNNNSDNGRSSPPFPPRSRASPFSPPPLHHHLLYQSTAEGGTAGGLDGGRLDPRNTEHRRRRPKGGNRSEHIGSTGDVSCRGYVNNLLLGTYPVEAVSTPAPAQGRAGEAAGFRPSPTTSHRHHHHDSARAARAEAVGRAGRARHYLTIMAVI